MSCEKTGEVISISLNRLKASTTLGRGSYERAPSVDDEATGAGDGEIVDEAGKETSRRADRAGRLGAALAEGEGAGEAERDVSMKDCMNASALINDEMRGDGCAKGVRVNMRRMMERKGNGAGLSLGSRGGAPDPMELGHAFGK